MTTQLSPARPALSWQEQHTRALSEVLLAHLQEHGGGPAADRAIDALDGLLLELHGASCWEEVA